MFVTKKGHVEVVKYLVENGADVHRARKVGSSDLANTQLP